LIKKLLDAGLPISWISHDVFKVSSPNGGTVLCGISKKDNIFVISADIARQDSWLQLLFHSENIHPEECNDYAGCELVQNQMMCEFLSTEAPEEKFKCLVKELDEAFKKRTNVRLFKHIDHSDKIMASVSRFLSINDEGYVYLAKILTKAIIERIDEKELIKFINDRVKTEGLRGISLLGICVNLLNPIIDGKESVKFLRDINTIRQVDAHFMSSDQAEKKKSVIEGPLGLSFVAKGAYLIDCTNKGIENLISIFKGE
jgi:hypothetical protein